MEKWDNPLYRFTDTKREIEHPDIFIPTSGMMYDGQYLEHLISGYQTLVVEGREMLSTAFKEQALQRGSIITNQTLPTRELTITYKLEDSNPDELQEKFKKLLNYLYRTNDVEIRFKDEVEYRYFGRYSTSDSVSGDRNSIVSSFTILCSNPLRYTAEFESDGYIAIDSRYDITPTKIEATLSADHSIQITNGEQVISITGASIESGDTLLFDFFEETLTIGEEDYTNIIDLTSDFENFIIKKGQRVTTNNGTLKIFYRGATI